MSADAPLALAARPREAQRALLLAALAAWTAIAPYLGEALGLVVKVPARVEVVDHVIPGLLIGAAALWLYRVARRRALRGEHFALLAAGVAFLAGFWVLVTHLPLLQDAAEDLVSWEAAIWHSVAAAAIVGLAGWFVLRSIPDA